MRWRGVREAADRHCLNVCRIGAGPPSVAWGERTYERWSLAPTTGVICYSDMIAMGFIRTLKSRGLKCHSDVSVIGFDNSATGEMASPSLTTVAAPNYRLGELGAQNLIAIIRGASSSHDPLVLPTTLVPRETTGPVLAEPSRLISTAAQRS